MKISKEALVLYEKALDSYYKNQFDKALRFFLESLEIEPNFAEAISYLANIHRFLDYKMKTKEDVFRLLTKALEIDPNSAIVMRNLGIGYAEIKKNLDKAMECYKKAIKLDPKIVVDLQLGNIHFRREEFDKAIEYFKKVPPEEPQYIWASGNLGILYQQIKMYEKATQFFELAVKSNPFENSYWIRLISCYALNRDILKAFKTIDRARIFLPNDLDLKEVSELIEKQYEALRKLFELNKKVKEKPTGIDETIKLLKEHQNIIRNALPMDTLINIEEKSPNDYLAQKYRRFREIQTQLQNYVAIHPKYPDLKDFTKFDLTTNLTDFESQFKTTSYTYPSKELSKKFYNFLSEVVEILYIANRINIIPYSVQKEIRKSIIKLGMKFSRLKIVEIAEKCKESEDSIVLTALDMIECNEIHAEYFSSTKTLAFDQRTNIDEVDLIMKKFNKWELQFCNNCGNKILDNKQQICEYCGEKL